MLETETQADAIKRKMAEIRNELPVSADIARHRVQQLTDWKYHMSKRPLPFLAIAAAAGYLLVPSKRVPERVVIHPSAMNPGVTQPEQSAPAKKGVVGGIAGAVATIALKQMTSIAAAQLSTLLTQRNGS